MAGSGEVETLFDVDGGFSRSVKTKLDLKANQGGQNITESAETICVLDSMKSLPPEEFAREMRLAAAAIWYEQGRASQEVAAQIAGLGRLDFLLALARMGRDSFHVDWRDLDRELERG